MDDQPALPPSQQPKRFFDVSPPEDFTPSATSRPVIVGHRPQQADPMMAPRPSAPAPTAPTAESDVVFPKVSHVPESPEATAPRPSESAEGMIQEEYDEVAHELPSGGVEESPAASALPPPASTAQPEVTSPAASQVVVVHHKPPASMGKKLVILVITLVIIALIIVVILKLKQHS
jgi:hypothetical protein